MNATTSYETAEAIATHLNVAIDEGGADQMLSVLSEVIMAKGEAQIAAPANCSLNELQELSKPGSKPVFSNVHCIVRSLGLRMVFSPVGDAR